MTDRIISEVSDFTGISYSQMLIRSRWRGYVKARSISMYFMKEFTQLNWREIGEIFRRDHATAMHAIKSVNDQIDTDKKYKNEIEQIRGMLLFYLDNPVSQEVFQQNDFFTN